MKLKIAYLFITQIWLTGKEKFSKLSAIPALPWKTPLQHLPTSRYQRNSLVIEKINLNSCLKLAQNIHCLKLNYYGDYFGSAISLSTDKSLCVAVPTLPSMPAHFPIALRLLLLSGKPHINLLNKQNRLQTEVLEGLQHLSFSGVDLARLLFEKLALLQYYRL